jgi:hypothetical protein
MNMRSKLTLSVVLGLASMALAKEPKPYQDGKLLQMDSVQCGTAHAEKASADDTVGNEPHTLLCQEYLLQAENVTYRIRPRHEKHAVLLPVGERAQFRLDRDRLLLRVALLDNKEREYLVISVMPSTDSAAAKNATIRLNHLQ